MTMNKRKKALLILLTITAMACQSMAKTCQETCFSKDCAAHCIMAEMLCFGQSIDGKADVKK